MVDSSNGHTVSMRVFITFCFIGALLGIATAQNVTDLISRLDSARGHLRNTEKSPSTEDQSEESDDNNKNIDSVNNQIDVIEANFKNTSHNKEVKGSLKPSLKAQNEEEKESDEFQLSADLSTIFSPDTSEGLESVEDVTVGTTGHLRHNKFSQSDSNPSNKTQSSLSSSTSASATEPTTRKSSLTSKQHDGNEVVLVSQASPTMSANLFRKGLAWMSDTYTLSIVVPVAAGFIFASVIIITVAMANCIKRRCRRKRLRRKVLPDSVRRMRPADRARLLAESSDEEF